MTIRPCCAIFLSFFIVLPSPGKARQKQSAIGGAAELQAPAGDRPTHIDRSGVTVIPNGRLITPRGVQVTVAPHPYGMVLSPDGQTLVTVNSGTAPFSISIITNLGGDHPSVAQIPHGFKPSGSDPRSVYIGAAISPDSRTVFVSEGNNGKIGIFSLATKERLGSMDLDGTFDGVKFQDSLTGDLKLSPDGRTLYALDIAHFRLVIFDVPSRKIVASLPVGYLPFGIALSPDGHTVYVSNAGTFRYSLVPGYDPKQPLKTGLDFPPFGYPSPQAAEGVTIGGRKIPGLGSPNTPASNSVWAVDVSNRNQPRVASKIRTGIPVGPGSVGGSSPSAVVATNRYVYVSNASQDSITVIDRRKRRVKATILLEPAPSVAGLRGVLPFGIALSPDSKRLYVACAGINAVAVIEAKNGKVMGYVPAGWFPSRIAVSPDGGTLYVANGKGFGAGPNGGPDFHRGPEGSYIGDITKGSVSIIRLASLANTAAPIEGVEPPAKGQPIPGVRWLRHQTEQVLLNNGFIPPANRAQRSPDFPIPPPGTASREIQYVVFIVKENRTFDQVFGQLKQVQGQLVN
ncbi:MAG: beta-propeller fold lactonase family protein, partial [Acidobacteriota bacterium]|nr:beta-propeller fold lactonase family protein [Acidobacteriota bacterium]